MTFVSRVIVVSILFLLSGNPLTTSAQDSTIVLLEDEIAPDFPEMIQFRVAVESAADIERIVLWYGTNGRSCQTGGSRQSITFDAGSQVEAEWEWELRRSGAIPPGATIWWQWEVEDAAGNKLLTERQEYVLADDTHVWQSLTDDGVTVFWYRGDAAFGQDMLDLSRQSLDHIQSELGLPRPETVQLWFYDSATAVKEAVVNVPDWTGGVAFPQYGITVVGVAPGQEAWAAHVVPHELTHLLEGMLTFNCRGVRLPTWLTEGLAQYAEGEPDAVEVARVMAALSAGSLPPLKSLAAGFSAYAEGAGQAYTQSGEVVAYLIRQHGPVKMTELLGVIQQGEDVDEALTAVYGFDTGGLDAAWRTSLGYAPTPEAAFVPVGTVTAVPTLALGGIPQSATAVPEMAASPSPSPTATILPTPLPTEPPTHTSQPVAQTTFDATPTPVMATEPAVEQNGMVWLWPVGALLLSVVIIFIVLKLPKRGG
jgi:cell division septation protein DedD